MELRRGVGRIGRDGSGTTQFVHLCLFVCSCLLRFQVKVFLFCLFVSSYLSPFLPIRPTRRAYGSVPLSNSIKRNVLGGEGGGGRGYMFYIPFLFVFYAQMLTHKCCAQMLRTDVAHTNSTHKCCAQNAKPHLPPSSTSSSVVGDPRVPSR